MNQPNGNQRLSRSVNSVFLNPLRLPSPWQRDQISSDLGAQSRAHLRYALLFLLELPFFIREDSHGASIFDHRYYRVLGKQGREWDLGHSDLPIEATSESGRLKTPAK